MQLKKTGTLFICASIRSGFGTITIKYQSYIYPLFGAAFQNSFHLVYNIGDEGIILDKLRREEDGRRRHGMESKCSKRTLKSIFLFLATGNIGMQSWR